LLLALAEVAGEHMVAAEVLVHLEQQQDFQYQLLQDLILLLLVLVE
jgi:hypothetical protein